MPLARSLALLSAASVALAACADAPTAARSLAPRGGQRIVNGTPTGSGSYASVGALLFDIDGNGKLNGDDEFCTGSLITPTVFLTAAHCVVTSYTPPGSQFYVSFAPDLYAKGIKVIAATSYVRDPLYGHDQANLHDLALVFLPAGSTKGLTPLQLPPAGYLDQLAAQGALSKTLFVNVGYGVTATLTGIPGFPYDGVRKSSKSEFMGLQPTWLGLLMNSNATGLGGDCYGDSGGPKFLDGNPNMILATVTTGDYNCRATTWDWRLDTPEARGFLGQYLTLP
ncbi:peptidase S1 and S6 chymotrypsin/Hap [Gemmatirosa kalamazoonensis]|uniref:Peptidase S1 and S6 chymotrypsin/Hap n=1 Tax=Gemmatirosa kalamazoonensis TaxID=861299 RepID=W0RDZ4_9BACT|nr:trypsin-like serine protease [Gemmatirosa kalamazoonensis]AHG89304.1 peptidase S1 and S6 chymotrypsin/Hap [Gemmatirosa kalamazoonensis]